jgi:hypothetical protein
MRAAGMGAAGGVMVTALLQIIWKLVQTQQAAGADNKDIEALRLTLRKGQAPIELKIVHLDLYFFHDLDIVQLNLEVRGGLFGQLQAARAYAHRRTRRHHNGQTAACAV